MKTLHCKRSNMLLCAILYIDYVMSLELIELRVPTHIPLGIRAGLFCRWALGPNDVLYSVKWYKDGDEFFRHVPKDDEPLRKFFLPGVNVEEFNLTGSNLTLASVVLVSSGRYRCEVSGERPQFQTVSEYADMSVVVPPAHGPTILDFKSQYRVGDHLNVSCLSGQAKPAVKLSWYINGELALPTLAHPLYVDDNGETSRLGMEFTIGESLVGNLKLQCLATIASIYWQSIERSAIVSETREDIQSQTVLMYPKNANRGLGRIKQQYCMLSSYYAIFLYFLYIISTVE